MAALTSGIISTFFATPADFIKTRMQSQLVGTNGKGTLYRYASGSYSQLTTTEIASIVLSNRLEMKVSDHYGLDLSPIISEEALILLSPIFLSSR
jgi:hypothetical protein